MWHFSESPQIGKTFTETLFDVVMFFGKFSNWKIFLQTLLTPQSPGGTFMDQKMAITSPSQSFKG